MGAELLGEFGLVNTPTDRRYLETHVARILDGEMTKAADADDRNEIACLGWCIALAPNVVRPAHRRGAAAAESSSSGTITSPLALAIITSAWPPSCWTPVYS